MEQRAFDDSALVARIVAGNDRVAEDALARRFLRPVKTMLRQRCNEPDLVDDLANETLLALLERLRSGALDDPDRLSAYVYGIARNIWLAYVRKELRRNTQPGSHLIDAVADDGDGQLETLLRAEENAAVRELLEELRNQRDREILFRSYILEQDKSVVCRHLGLSPANFDRVIHRARRRFREIVLSRAGEQALGVRRVRSLKGEV